MKIKTSDLTGPALDWATATAEYTDRRVELTGGKTGVRVLRDPTFDGSEHWHWFVFFGSTYWAQGGPIIEREGISVASDTSGMFEGFVWFASKDDILVDPDSASGWRGPTPLIAAMRCFVTSRLGEEVEVPEELK